MTLAGERTSQREGRIIEVRPTDDVLIERGDAAAFEQLYERHVDGIYRYCRLRLPTAADAEDGRHRDHLRAGVRSLSAESDRLVSRLALHHRPQRDREHLALERQIAPGNGTFDYELPLIDPGRTPEESLLIAEEQRRLIEMLARLPEDQRRVIELRLAGLNGGEIAAVLGRSSAAMRQLQYRATQHLRRLLSRRTTMPTNDAGNAEERLDALWDRLVAGETAHPSDGADAAFIATLINQTPRLGEPARHRIRHRVFASTEGATTAMSAPGLSLPNRGDLIAPIPNSLRLPGRRRFS